MLQLKSRTVHGVLEELAQSRPEQEFLFYQDQSFSYGALDAAAGKVACGLQRAGVRRNDKVAILCSNRPEFLHAWFGISKIGAVQVPINTAHKGDLLEYFLMQSDAAAIICETLFLQQLQPLVGKVPALRRCYALTDGAAPSGAVEAEPWDDLVDNDGAYQSVELAPSDPAAMMFTSGTTGPSKGALIPHNYQIELGETICGMASYRPEDRLFNALPLFHGNAQTLSTVPALLSGASMLLAKKFSASTFWEDVRRRQCTEFNYIGGILPILLKAEEKPDDRDNPLRIMVGAGASKAVAETFEKRFDVTLIESYGMSEIGVPLLSTPQTRRYGSCGKQSKTYDLRLIDDEGREVGPNTPGELLLRPKRPNAMMLEYYGMPEKTVEAWRDLWFHTGDFLQRDEDGFFYFVDRKKDALRRRGENISSFEVEMSINAHPDIQETAVVAVKSELGEDEVLACVVLKEGATLSAEALLEFCRDRMAHFMTPRYIRFLSSFPKTATERVQKFRLRQEGVTADTFDSGAGTQKGASGRG